MVINSYVLNKSEQKQLSVLCNLVTIRIIDHFTIRIINFRFRTESRKKNNYCLINLVLFIQEEYLRRELLERNWLNYLFLSMGNPESLLTKRLVRTSKNWNIKFHEESDIFASSALVSSWIENMNSEEK